MSDYAQFLEAKAQLGTMDGFEPGWMRDFLFDFQRVLVEWAIRKGRGAHFADCGLGKTPMQLVWAENIVRRENKPVLILTPLAVSAGRLYRDYGQPSRLLRASVDLLPTVRWTLPLLLE